MEGSGAQAVLFHFDPIRAGFLLSSCSDERFLAPVHQKILKTKHSNYINVLLYFI